MQQIASKGLPRNAQLGSHMHHNSERYTVGPQNTKNKVSSRYGAAGLDSGDSFNSHMD